MTDASGPTAFFSKTYDEAFALLIEARNYVAYEEAGDRAIVDDTVRLNVSLETMRLTTRVIEIMAWLLHQKAVHAGEISREAVLDPARRLSRHDICLGEPKAAARLPRRLGDLVSRSRKLYVRVLRLDEMMVRDIGPPRLDNLWAGD